MLYETLKQWYLDRNTWTPTQERKPINGPQIQVDPQYNVQAGLETELWSSIGVHAGLDTIHYSITKYIYNLYYTKAHSSIAQTDINLKKFVR